MKNHIISETHYFTEYIHGKAQKKIIKYISYYNSQGKQFKYVTYSNGKPFITWKIIYDANGNVIKETAYDNKMRLFNTLTYDCDSSGNEIAYKQFDNKGKMVVYQKREYNEKNENTKLYNPTDTSFKEFRLEQEYFYNEDGKFSKIYYYSKYSDKPYSVSLYQYNEKGKLINSLGVNNNDTSIHCLYSYNEADQLIEKNYPVENEKIGTGKYMINSSVGKVTFKYESIGNVIEEMVFRDNVLIEKSEFKYTFK